MYASEAGQLDPVWDHGYVATSIRGPVVKVLGPNNRQGTLNRDKVCLVDPHIDWGSNVHVQRSCACSRQTCRTVARRAWPWEEPGNNISRTQAALPLHKRPHTDDDTEEYQTPKSLRVDIRPHPVSDRVLPSHSKRNLTPPTGEQVIAKRLCIAVVREHCGGGCWVWLYQSHLQIYSRMMEYLSRRWGLYTKCRYSGQCWYRFNLRTDPTTSYANQRRILRCL